MKRRAFLGSLAGLMAAPAAALLPRSALPPIGMDPAAPEGDATYFFTVQPHQENPLFRGQIGRYDGIRIDTRAAKVYSEALAHEFSRADRRTLLEHGWRFA